MGGITGFLDHSNCLTKQDLLSASALLSHRGGNGTGFLLDQKEHYTIAIANERTTRIAKKNEGKQPLTSACGNYTITFDGAIYNYLQLRETLIKYGVIFKTLTDTEVILECYKKWGIQAIEKLDGSFAFVIFDKKLNQLIVSRDQIGAKPLYYYKVKQSYIFASEIKALLSYPIVYKKINPSAIATYFRYGFFINEETIYKDIFKAKKGFLTIIDIFSGNSYELPIKRNQYNSKSIPELIASEQEISTHIEELLTESILKRNDAHVPVGILLNGTYDSAIVAALLQTNQNKRIKTYSLGFEGKNLNETIQAKNIATHLKTNHSEFFLTDQKIVEIVKNIPQIFDEPIGNSNAILLLFMAEQAKDELKIILNADGGNQLFGGYRTYDEAIKYQKFETLDIPAYLKGILKKIYSLNSQKTKAILDAEGLLAKYVEINACFTSEQIKRLITTAPQKIAKTAIEATTIKDLLRYDLNTYLPNDLLYKGDKCFMQFGIENRDVLLKTELVAYLSALDPKLFGNGKDQKYLLKKITHKYIPEEFIHKTNADFAPPLATWLKTILKPLVDKYLTADKLNEHQLLSVTEVFKIKAAFKANGSYYNAQKIWLILQLQMWYEHWIKG